MTSLTVKDGPDRYDLAEALIYGHPMNRRTVMFVTTGKMPDTNRFWEATIQFVERVDMTTQTFGIKVSMHKGDNQLRLGVGTYSTLTKTGFILLVK